MTNKLKEKKVPFQLTSSGTTVLVPRDQVYDLRLSLAAEGLPVERAVELLAANLSLNVTLEDAAEGVTAFLEKRPPAWKDR